MCGGRKIHAMQMVVTTAAAAAVPPVWQGKGEGLSPDECTPPLLLWLWLWLLFWAVSTNLVWAMLRLAHRSQQVQ